MKTTRSQHFNPSNNNLITVEALLSSCAFHHASEHKHLFLVEAAPSTAEACDAVQILDRPEDVLAIISDSPQPVRVGWSPVTRVDGLSEAFAPCAWASLCCDDFPSMQEARAHFEKWLSRFLYPPTAIIEADGCFSCLWAFQDPVDVRHPLRRRAFRSLQALLAESIAGDGPAHPLEFYWLDNLLIWESSSSQGDFPPPEISVHSNDFNYVYSPDDLLDALERPASAVISGQPN